MADPTYDIISASTLADMKADIVYDEFFVESSTQRKLRASGALDPYLGGSVMQEPFQYDRVAGGAVAPGADVNVLQRQILAATAFQPKKYEEQVPLNLWQTNVINAGPAGKVKLADLYMTNAVQALNTDLGIDFFRHGQASPTGVGDNRAIFINGAAEALNNGLDNSWDGNLFTSYGGQTRNGAIGNVLNSIPIWFGDQLGNTGQIAYKGVIEMYLNCNQEPSIGVCNKALYAYLLERQEPKQNFTQEKDASIGLVGLKFMNSYIHVDKLCPSTKYGQIVPSGLSQTTAVQPATFTSRTTASIGISNLPSNVTINPGEVLFFFRMEGWKVRPAEDEEYNFNFTPPIRSQTNSDLIVMFLKAGINFYTTSPRDNAHGYGAGY
jgi:hypothetical protein